MAERRTHQFMLALTPSEREVLQRLSEQDGSSAADVVRRLILSEARRFGLVSVDSKQSHQKLGAAS